MMGFKRHLQQEKFIYLNQKNRERKLILPLHLFKLVKLSLDRLLPSRAYIRFTLQMLM